jgi:hypothetical protein
MKKREMDLSSLLTADFEQLLESNGAAFIKRAGLETVRQVVVDVLSGQNLRTSTEHLTRSRLARLNAATFLIYLRGLQAAKDFTRMLPTHAAKVLAEKRGQKAERELCQWMIGMTGKGVQNVLRDDSSHLQQYTEAFAKNLHSLAAEMEAPGAQLRFAVQEPGGKRTGFDWHDLLSLFCTIGSQTLAIRGSEKSTYGKLFERLVLGSVLSILGCRLTGQPPSGDRGVFWLSSNFGEREADATLLISPGRAVTFDLGFIGKGNPEITKDKVSRFERHLEAGGRKYHSTTCIIVDRIADGSSLEAHASRIGAKIIQMSMSYWPLELARWLKSSFSLTSDILKVPKSGLTEFFQTRMAGINVEEFVKGLSPGK